MKIKQYVAFALMGLALGACKRPGGEGPDVVEPEGKPTSMKLTIRMPESIRSYAPGDADANATIEEVNINYVDVFVYDDGGGFALKHFHLLPADLTIPGVGGPHVRTATLDDVRTGRKQVYVGVNLPTPIVDRLKTGHFVNEKFSSLDLVATDGSVAFFSDGSETSTDGHIILNLTEAGPNAIIVDVSRLVAKVIVKADQDIQDGLDNNTLAVSGGRISDLEFTMGQRSDSIFVMPLVANVDPHYANGTFDAGEKEEPVNTTLYPYEPVNDYVASLDWGAAATQKIYVPENTVDAGSGGAQHRDVTYVSVKATFTPDRLEDTGLPATPGTTFYAVFTGNDDDEGLGQRYFSTQTSADNYIIANPSIASAEAHEYKDGSCYYRIYLNPVGNYSVLRNTIYEATITHINYIGTPTPEMLPGSAASPTHPTFTPAWEVQATVEDDDAIADGVIARGDLAATVQIVKWLSHAAEYELN